MGGVGESNSPAFLAEVEEADGAVEAGLPFTEAFPAVLAGVAAEAVGDGLAFELEALLVVLRLAERVAECVEADEVDAVAGGAEADEGVDGRGDVVDADGLLVAVDEPVYGALGREGAAEVDLHADDGVGAGKAVGVVAEELVALVEDAGGWRRREKERKRERERR